MAARKRRTTLNDSWRDRIQVSMLINRLQDHIFNNTDLTGTQLKAIDILLKKVAPDLTHTTGEVTHSIADEITERMNQARERAIAERTTIN